jgi:hypothetical protein
VNASAYIGGTSVSRSSGNTAQSSTANSVNIAENPVQHIGSEQSKFSSILHSKMNESAETIPASPDISQSEGVIYKRCFM